MATMQFAMRDILPEFLIRYPKVNVVAHATDQNVDIVGENYDVAIRAHSDPLPDSTLVQRTLAPAPWFLFAGSAYLDANEAPQTPQDLHKHPSLFMMRTGVAPVWRQYDAAEPENRLVARTLERRWNEALEKVAALEQVLERLDPAPDVLSKKEPDVLSKKEEEELRELAWDLPALWHDGAAPFSASRRTQRYPPAS